MTIEELAQRAGMTVRNVREHQTRGLLPPPALSGRKGIYDERHLARLRLISSLQARGLNLGAIAWLVERAPAEATEEVARFERALFAPWHLEEPEIVTTRELAARYGPDVAARDRAVALGLLEEVGDGRWRLPTPAVMRAGADLVALGVPLSAALDVFEQLRRHTDAIAATFTRLFLEQVWEPFDAAGRPAADWERVRETLERLRPLASEVVLASFQQAMTQATARYAAPGSDRPDAG